MKKKMKKKKHESSEVWFLTSETWKWSKCERMQNQIPIWHFNVKFGDKYTWWVSRDSEKRWSLLRLPKRTKVSEFTQDTLDESLTNTQNTCFLPKKHSIYPDGLSTPLIFMIMLIILNSQVTARPHPVFAWFNIS